MSCLLVHFCSTVAPLRFYSRLKGLDLFLPTGVTRRVGFTLIELLTAIAVMSVLTMVAVPSFIKLIHSNRLSSESNALLSLISLGRSEAIKRSQQIVLCKSKDGVTCSAAPEIKWNRGIILFADVNAAGTGRIYSEADRHSTQEQSLFAVLDTLPAQTPDYRNFVEVGDAASAKRPSNLTEATSQSALVKLVQGKKGWKRPLTETSGSSAERSITQIALLGGNLFATTFIPGGNDNIREGKSRLYCLNYKTGTADASSPSCSKGTSTLARSNITASDAVDLGPGLATSPALHTDSTVDSSLSVLIQTSTGTITYNSVHTGQSVHSGEIDWREIHR